MLLSFIHGYEASLSKAFLLNHSCTSASSQPQEFPPSCILLGNVPSFSHRHIVGWDTPTIFNSSGLRIIRFSVFIFSPHFLQLKAFSPAFEPFLRKLGRSEGKEAKVFQLTDFKREFFLMYLPKFRQYSEISANIILEKFLAGKKTCKIYSFYLKGLGRR